MKDGFDLSMNTALRKSKIIRRLDCSIPLRQARRTKSIQFSGKKISICIFIKRFAFPAIKTPLPYYNSKYLI